MAVPAVRVPQDDDPPPGAGDRMWAELGGELARRRKAAGRSQQQLADLTGQYSRGAVSRAERGRGDMARPFWEIVGRLLGVGDEFAARYDEIRACLEPGKRAAVRPADGGLRCELALTSAKSRHAIAAYRRLGWPIAALEGRLELVTGKAVDVLEVARPAGVVAVGAWEETGGRESVARGVPGLPVPESALAVAERGDHWFFLVSAGRFPWRAGRARGVSREAAIRWHSAGSRVPLPPSGDGRGMARWVRLPVAELRPAPPQAVLDLLAWAVAVAPGPDVLVLRGGVITAPAVPSP